MNEEVAVEVLKVDESGRVQTPRERREEIVAAYEATGMTGRQFAAYCGMGFAAAARRVSPLASPSCSIFEPKAYLFSPF